MGQGALAQHNNVVSNYGVDIIITRTVGITLPRPDIRHSTQYVTNTV